MEKPSYLAVIAHPGFRYLWLNQILLQLAYNTLNFALIIWVYKLTGLNTAVSALILTVYLPTLFFIMIAGVLADLLDKRRIIQVLNLLFASGFMLFLLTKNYFALILANSFFINSLSQFFMPAEGSSIPQLVPKKLLILANSLFSLTIYASFMLGFAISGPILTHWGINTIFILGATLFGVSFILSQKLPSLLSSHTMTANLMRSSVSLRNIFHLTLEETKHTLRIIKGKINVIVAIILLASVQAVVGMLATVMPAYLETVLKIHAAESSYFLMLPLGLGTILGALAVGRYTHNVPRRYIVIPAIVFAGLIFLAVGFSPLLAEFIRYSEFLSHKQKLRYLLQAPSLASVFATAAFFIGVSAVAIIIPSQTVIQENVPNRIRGKIWSVLVLMMSALSAAIVLLSGVLSDIFGVTPVFIWLGIIILMIGLIAYRPAYFFHSRHLPIKFREFLGQGHWAKD